VCIIFYTSCHQHEINRSITLSEYNIKRQINSILNTPENNEEINFMDSFADEVIDKKIKMGMGFHELNELFNNELERDKNTNEGDIVGGFIYNKEFLPYFKEGWGEILFVIHKEYGLWWYIIKIYEKEDDFYNKFEECLTVLNKKYGEESNSNYRGHYWIKNENKLPSGVSVVETFINEMGGGLRIDIDYFSKNYFRENLDQLRVTVRGILERRSGIPDCCTRAAMRGI
jgi:hypothetical protein